MNSRSVYYPGIKCNVGFYKMLTLTKKEGISASWVFLFLNDKTMEFIVLSFKNKTNCSVISSSISLCFVT